MRTLTVLTEDAVVAVEAMADGDRMLIAETDVEAVFGWHLKPEGLCRGDVCMPVREDSGVRRDGRVDLTATAGLLGSSVAVDDDLAAISVPAERRRAALKGRQAADFTLPDLDGALHSLEEFKDRKRLLVAFASW